MESRVSTDAKDVAWMNQAVELAWRSNAVTSAYCVGCVIVDRSSQRCLSTGYSRELPGNTHAEECALRKLPEDPHGARLDMYTTMEPCSERLSGNTPCCTNILQSGRIRRVLLGATEPENLVRCEGVKILLDAGIEVLSVQTATNKSELAKACLAPNVHILDYTGSAGLRVRSLRQDDAEELKDLIVKSGCCVVKEVGSGENFASLEFWNSGSRKGVCVEKAANAGQKTLAASETYDIVGFIIFASETNAKRLCVLSCALREFIDKPLVFEKLLRFIAEMVEEDLLSISLRIEDALGDLLLSGWKSVEDATGSTRSYTVDLCAYRNKPI